jgi:hypothetical protein
MARDAFKHLPIYLQLIAHANLLFEHILHHIIDTQPAYPLFPHVHSVCTDRPSPFVKTF